MKKKVLLLVMFFLIGIGLLIWWRTFFYSHNEIAPSKNREQSLLTEQFINNHLMTEDKMIRTNFTNQEDGSLFLSESNGLWLQYLTLTGDTEQFAEAYEATKKHLQFKNKLFSWRISNGEKANTNALIDDLRIVEALFLEGERTNNKKWIEEALHISKAIVKFHQYDNLFVDFYDREHLYANEQITISYLDIAPFQFMVKYQVLAEEKVQETIQFLEQLPLQNGFYPMSFDMVERTFHYDDTVNLIDQLYIAFHLEKANIRTDEFYKWIDEVFYSTNKIFGRYDAKTGVEAVEYESVAVYALTILYALKRDETTFAKDVWEKLQSMQISDKESSYYGGYVHDHSTHSFDNLLALLAERELKIEKVIP